ncbi:phosphatase inhibitor-domain-containing protein [Mrakia frigida]|uniref:PPP1R11/YPI1 family protein n=1 Tax=Mrakia frigida TaxID=29902 RepID=UPI003FCC1E4F
MQRQASPPVNIGSQTQTLPAPPPAPTAEEVGTLRLRGRHVIAEGELGTGRGVKWVEGTIDNEGMGRKSSKICCIYHKPRPFDESSSDESSSEEDEPSRKGSGDAGPSSGSKKKVHRKHGHSHGPGEECNDGKGGSSGEVNKLDGGGKAGRLA